MPKIFFISLLLLSFNIYSQTNDRRDGNWWNNLDANTKYYFVTGFFDGMDLGNNFSYWGITNSNTECNCISKTIESYNYYADKYFKNVTNVQLVDGLNDFFSDYRNRRIRISSAVWLVTNSIVGTPKEELDKMIESWRKNAVD